MSNEAFFSAPEAMPGVRRLLKRMVDLSHQLDLRVRQLWAVPNVRLVKNA